ncbi:transglycosylase domain-containing protein [Tellurirhabdus rosea]|uniref:transglycosylase domain-containing protein n=1 Tax=Tellurirhabdus rosea TaxID=2674997 RepID=UPI00224DEEAD|nr:transglycosylase domain-containing protein [Tellurirhabdus rosea]
MQVNTKKVLKITGWVLLGLLAVGAVGGAVAFSKREALLQTVLERGIKKAKRDYKLDVTVGSSRFTGLSTVAFTDIAVVPEERDSLLRIDSVEVGVSLWPLLVGKVAVSSLNLQNGLVNVVRRDSLTNIDFLLKRKKDSTQTEEKRRTDLSVLADNLVDNVLSKIPDDMNVQNLEFRLTDGNRRQSFLTQTAVIDDENLSSTILVNGTEATWHLAGQVDGSDREAAVKLYADGKPLEIPYLQERFDLKLQADTLGAELREAERSGGEFHLEGVGSVRNLRINHPAVALNDVVVPQASMDARVFVGENYVGIDSSSVVRVGRAEARPFVKYTLSPNKIYEVALHTDPQEAQAMFDAFPQGLFESLDGIRVSGKLKYDLRLHLDSSLPDSVKFDATMTPYDFKILQFGKVNLAKMNQPFEHEVYEKGKLVRKFIVPLTEGPENPDFVSFNNISPNIRNAVLTAEDYNFFTHKGFNEKAFRVSIATNYKEKKFKRGASTISMQLVKNVFLNRNKTLSRKFEEILIVWLIENQRIVSKQRMYEVYLNIIEWGRDIYGIGEASRYYFAKHPSQLDIGESIFLAYVVPSPKRALNHFNPDGSVKTYLRGYFRLIGKIMARRGLTPADSSAYGFYGVRVREGLRYEIAPADSLYLDSLEFEPDMEMDSNGEGNDLNDVFRRLFGRDRNEEVSTPNEESGSGAQVQPADTVKSRRQLRQERRERKRRERNRQDAPPESGEVIDIE